MRLSFTGALGLLVGAVIFCVLWIGVTATYGSVTTNGALPIAKQGFPAPDFEILRPDGSTLHLADFQGQVVVLNFWASWCPPCQTETPVLEGVYQQYQSQNVVILGVNTTYQDDPAQVDQFLTAQAVTYPIGMDPTGAVSRSYLISALPTTFILDQQGIIRKIVYGGPLREALLDIEISTLLRTP